MAQINNNEVLLKLTREAKIQTSIDKVPNQLAEKIVPVLNVNPDRILKVRSGIASDTTTQTIFITSTTKETYLVGVLLSVAKDVVNDGSYTSVTAVPFGMASSGINVIRYEPLDANQLTSFVTFDKIPLKLEKNTSIVVANATGTASIDASCIIYFYEVEQESG